MFIPLPKYTILVPSGPDHDPDRKHLFVILTAPCGDANNVLSVAWVSLRSVDPRVPYFDRTCVLNVGDHPFIKHPTWVDYAKARIDPVAAIDRGIRDGKLIPHDPMSPEVFVRIAQGLCLSDETPSGVKAFYWLANP